MMSYIPGPEELVAFFLFILVMVCLIYWLGKDHMKGE